MDPISNPMGGGFSSFGRVVRGGSFASTSVGELHAHARAFFDPNTRSSAIGVRCMKLPGGGT
jgi:formylglycine-generating enzyme required for sulfatase activity